MISNKTDVAVATPAIPQEFRSLLGKRPLLSGESPEMYDALFARVADAVNAVDIIDYIYVKDVVDLTWEIERIRWFQSVMIDNERRRAIAQILYPIRAVVSPSWDVARRKAYAYVTRESKTKAVSSAIAKHGMDDDSVAAAAFGQELPRLEITGRIAAAAESRRDKVFREIDRRRESLGRSMRKFFEAENGKVPELLEAAREGERKSTTEGRQEPPKEKNAA